MSEFSIIATEVFAQLASTYGLNFVEQKRVFLAYESAVCRLAIGHDDQRSFEIGLNLSQRNNDAQPGFSFDEVLRAQAVPSHLWPQGYTARSPQQLRRLLEQMERIITEYAVPLLDGDSSAWVNLENLRHADCIEYAEGNEIRQVQEALTTAWAARDYTQVVKVLVGREAKLNKSDLRKLEYAKRQLGQAM